MLMSYECAEAFEATDDCSRSAYGGAKPRCPGTLLLVSLQAASKMNGLHATHASKEAYTGVQPHPAAIGQPERKAKPPAPPCRLGSCADHDAPASMMPRH